MGRLIDEDDIISLLVYHHFDDDKGNFDLLIHNLCKEVKRIPIAYDVDKVVEQLEEACISPSDYPGYTVDIEKAIEIVKGGGVDG